MQRFKLDSRLVMGPLNVATDVEALSVLARRMVELGYVKSTYPEAVIARERVFPTGLPTKEFGVAVPHCDVVHVEIPTIALAKLARPVEFGLMGDDGTKVLVQLVIMLAIKDPETQIDVLKRIALMIRDPDMLKRISSAADSEEVIRVLREMLDC